MAITNDGIQGKSLERRWKDEVYTNAYDKQGVEKPKETIVTPKKT